MSTCLTADLSNHVHVFNNLPAEVVYNLAQLQQEHHASAGRVIVQCIESSYSHVPY